MMFFTPALRAVETTNATISVLVVDQGDSRPAFLEFISPLRQILTMNPSSHVVIYREDLDLARFEGTGYRTDLEGWLHKKYQDRKMDAIVASGETAIDFIMKIHQTVWPRTPVIAVGTAGMETALLAGQTNVTGVSFEIDVTGTLKAAMRLCTNTRRIAFVSSAENDLLELHKQDLEKVEDFCTNRFELIKLIGLTMAETKQRLANLSPDTIVFYDDVWMDASEQIFATRDALEELSSVSRAPIFSYSESYIGYGMVGGFLHWRPEIGRGGGRPDCQRPARRQRVFRAGDPEREQPTGIRRAGVSKIRFERKSASPGQPGAIPYAHLVGGVSPARDRHRGGVGHPNRFDCGTAAGTPPQAAG